MPNYNNFMNLPSLKGKLKPITCKACRDDLCSVGVCPKCLENQAWNKDYLETHTFVYDTMVRSYHYSGHNDFKSLLKRLPNEHPYMFYGIELEVAFDDDHIPQDMTESQLQSFLEGAIKICPLFVVEWDGSCHEGMEFIFPPCSYAFLTAPKTVKMFKGLFKYLADNGALLDQPNGYGMHIHLSRKFFDYGETKLGYRYSAYNDLNWLFTKFQKQIELLGGRKYTMYCRSKIDKMLNDGRMKSLLEEYGVTDLSVAVGKGGEVPEDDHYSAVNMSGNTIEARVFKSTIDYEQMMANVELVRNFAHAVRNDQIATATLNEILHTKDNLYLDKHIQKVRMACAKNGETLDLEVANDNRVSKDVDTEGVHDILMSY